MPHAMGLTRTAAYSSGQDSVKREIKCKIKIDKQPKMDELLAVRTVRYMMILAAIIAAPIYAGWVFCGWIADQRAQRKCR